MRGYGDPVEWARVAAAMGGWVVSSRVAGADVRQSAQTGADQSSIRNQLDATKMITRFAATLTLALSALPASAQEDCEDWNTGAFFYSATAETVATCLEAGADLNARYETARFFTGPFLDTDGGNTPLHFASGSSWDLAVTTVLLAAGADVDARNQRGATPLHMAARSNHNPAVVAELARAGADLDARDAEGNTPLHASRLFGYPPVIHLLLELGADPTLVNDSGQVADPMDCGYWNTEAFARVATAEATAACLEAGADVNARNENGITPLLLATSHPGGRTPGAPASEDPAVVSVLLEAGADVDARGRGGNTALINAAGGKLLETTRGGMFDLGDNPGIVAALLAAGADVNARSQATTPLHGAAFAEDLESVRMLLASGADLHARDYQGKTPLLAAADWGGFRNPDVLEALVEAGADVNDRDEVGRTVLEYALRSPADRVIDVVRRLLDLGADAKAPGVLSVAVRQGDNPELIGILLAEGADVNNPGQSPLHWAAYGGGPGAIAALVASGAEVNTYNHRGQTPLHRAIEVKKPANVAALIEAGADVHARIQDGDTPLHMAAKWPRSLSSRDDDPRPDTLMVIALVAAGADVNARNDHGETPLHLAMRNRHQPVADKLLALGADPNALDDLGRVPRPAVCDWTKNRFFLSAPWQSVLGCLQAGADVHARGGNRDTPLHQLVSDVQNDGYPFARVIAAFAEAGADVNARDRGGGTPLHIAAGSWRDGETALATALLAAGAEVNARDSGGATPLHRAAGGGRTLAMISLLVDAGADLRSADNGGRTALHMALRSDRPAIAAKLIELGADTSVRDDSGHVANPVDCARFNTATFFHLAPAEVVASCIQGGVDVSPRPQEDGRLSARLKPLHFAAMWARDPAVVPLLVQAGADVNARDGSRRTPLHRAAEKSSNPAMITALIDAGADVHAWTDDIVSYHYSWHGTPLHAAAGSNGNPAVTARLLEAGANVNTRTEENHASPLHRAAFSNRNPAVAALLIQAGADVNAWGVAYWDCCYWRSSKPPLHLAARSNPGVFVLLLEAGADPAALDEAGATPMDHARENKALQELEVVKRSGR